jgi:hypothetical protein
MKDMNLETIWIAIFLLLQIHGSDCDALSYTFQIRHERIWTHVYRKYSSSCFQ